MGRGRESKPRAGTAVIAGLLAGIAAVDVAQAAAAGGAGPLRLGGRIEGLAIARFDRSTPTQAPQARLELFAEQRLVPGLRWRLSATGLAGGPPKDPTAGVFDLDRTFQNHAPSLEFDDAWLDWHGDGLDVRVGKQRFSWGRLDATQPNDLLNPREYEDPFLDRERDRKIAVPAIAATWLFPRAWRPFLPEESSLTVAWVPVAVAWRFPLSRERWFAPAARAPDSLAVGPLACTPCPCDVAIEQSLRNGPAPARQLDEGNVGIRFAARSGRTDWAVSFYDGFDIAPNFDVPIRIAPGPTDAPGRVTAFTELVPAYRRFASLGADAARTVGPFTVRAEGAWRWRRPWAFAVDQVAPRLLSDPAQVARLFAGETVTVPAWVERDAIEWGIGADTVIRGFVPLLELYQVVLIHNDQRLLVPDVDTRLNASLRRRWLGDRVGTEVVFTWGFEGDYRVVRAEADWDVGAGVQLVAGVLGIGGNRNTIIGQYAGRGEGYARVRWSF